MAVLADLKRRFGVGAGGILLYPALFAGVVVAVEIPGDIPTGGAGRGVPPQTLVPALFLGFGLLGVTLAASNLPTYLSLVRSDTPDTGGAANASGRVVLTGDVEPIEGTLTSPVDGTPAVAYTTRVLENSRDDVADAEDSEENWAAVHVGEATTRFAVDDGSGPVTVDPSDARLSLADEEQQLFTRGDDLPAEVREYLADAGASVDTADAHVRVEATALEPGEEAFVAGRGTGHGVDATLVAEGDHAKRVRDRVVTGGGLGAVATALGVVGLLVVAGAV